MCMCARACACVRACQTLTFRNSFVRTNRDNSATGRVSASLPRDGRTTAATAAPWVGLGCNAAHHCRNTAQLRGCEALLSHRSGLRAGRRGAAAAERKGARVHPQVTAVIARSDPGADVADGFPFQLAQSTAGNGRLRPLVSFSCACVRAASARSRAARSRRSFRTQTRVSTRPPARSPEWAAAAAVSAVRELVYPRLTDHCGRVGHSSPAGCMPESLGCAGGSLRE
jgi:hypothetical protein